jgi:protein-glutamine gamma-glutamyltransferase
MLEVRKRQQLNLRELFQLNWFLGSGLGLLSLWPVFYVDFPVVPHIWLALALISLCAIRPQVIGWLPKQAWYVIPFGLVALLVLDFYFTAETVPALVRLNILLVLYRCLSFRRKREDLQLIVLCLFLVIIAGVRTVAMSFVIQVLLFTALAMAFLFNITLMENSRDSIVAKGIWDNFTWSAFLRKLLSRCDMSFLVVAALSFVSVVVISALLFLMIPRVDFNAALPFLGLQRSSQTGFSERISFGDVTSIRNNDRVALRVEVDSEGIIPVEPYWRMVVLDEYSDGEFRLSQAIQNNSRASEKLTRISFDSLLIGQSEAPAERNRWTFYLEGGVARYLPLTGRFQLIRLQESRELAFLRPIHVLGTSRVNAGLLVYQVENMEFSGVFQDPTFGVEGYDLHSDWHPEMNFFPSVRRTIYPDTTMALPNRESDVAYLEELVELIGGGEALTAPEFATRATAYLQRRHSYSMTYALPETPEDHVVRWMKLGSPGHCEVFAGALILLCRTAGIPARAVTGFRGGTWNGFENYFMVRNSDAHAWVEIFDGAGNWLRFDPTPGGSSAVTSTGVVADVGSVMADSSFSAYVDSLRIVWYRRIVSFDQGSQIELWSMIQEGYGRISIMEWTRSIQKTLYYWWQLPWDWERLLIVVRLLIGALVFLLLIAFCVGRDRLSWLKFKRVKTDKVRRKAGRHLSQMRMLQPPQYDVDGFNYLVARLERLRFGPPGRDEGWQVVLRQARLAVRHESRCRKRGVPIPAENIRNA